MSIVIRPGSIIGHPDADEDDDFLFHCFIKSADFEQILDIEDAKSILIGRTGSGKTAIIRYIENNCQNVDRIDPKRISLDYIANSNILAFLENLNIDLHLFYELLWKHVITVHLIRNIFRIKDEKAEITFFDYMRNLFGNDRRKIECIEYLKDWGSSFWIDTDVQVREIAKKFEEKLESAIGAEALGITLSAAAAGGLETEVRETVSERAKKVVDEIQIGKLNRVLDVIESIISENRQKEYFVCLDNLDERWIDQKLQFRFIRALIETIRAFRRIKQLKVIVALRSDFFERALYETRDLGFQREKYESYIYRVRWNPQDLRKLVD